MFDRYTTTKTSCTEENLVRSHRTVFRDLLIIEDDQRLSNFHLTIILTFTTETAFMDGEVQNVCEIIDDYQISIDRDLPQDLWDRFKKEGFMGMIIPKSYGGKGFSAHGHSQVVQKISSCSSNVSGTIAVPNSLGPGKCCE